MKLKKQDKHKRKKSKDAKIMFCGIYSITNKINGKKYIGQSIDIHERWLSHKRKSSWNDQSAKILYKAFKKYGLENFEFKIEKILYQYTMSDIFTREQLVADYKKELDEAERKYIKKYDSFDNGYNMNQGNDTLTNKYHYKIPLYYYTTEYRPNLYEEWDNGVFTLVDEKTGKTIFRDCYDIADETWEYKSLGEILEEVDEYEERFEDALFGIGYSLSNIKNDYKSFIVDEDELMASYEEWLISNDSYYK